jgi:hypothetical protein
VEKPPVDMRKRGMAEGGVTRALDMAVSLALLSDPRAARFEDVLDSHEPILSPLDDLGPFSQK